jgi:hypothetical protein
LYSLPLLLNIALTWSMKTFFHTLFNFQRTQVMTNYKNISININTWTSLYLRNHVFCNSWYSIICTILFTRVLVIMTLS